MDWTWRIFARCKSLIINIFSGGDALRRVTKLSPYCNAQQRITTSVQKSAVMDWMRQSERSEDRRNQLQDFRPNAVSPLKESPWQPSVAALGSKPLKTSILNLRATPTSEESTSHRALLKPPLCLC